ncbi:conserved transmembrane domain protein [Mycobacterium xenopi 3993]|nr:conserved transmembrane domain protein [Mycobacterium xenopi 3993]
MVGAGVRPDAGAAGGGAAAGPGYLLLRDAVSTPRSYLSDTAPGWRVCAAASRQDFAVALASHVLDGGVVVKVLLAGLWLAGWVGPAGRTGAARCWGPGQFVATTLAIWNPMSPSGYCRGIGVCWSATAACPGLRRAWWICASV